MKKVIYLNGKYVDQNDASISVFDLAIHRAYGIFDFFKILKGYNPYLDLYINRFFRSSELARIPINLIHAEMRNIVNELITQNGLTECGIKIIATAGTSYNGYEIHSDPTLLLMPFDLPKTDAAIYTRGTKLLPAHYMRDIPEVKTINYMYAGMYSAELKESGSIDFLFHDGVYCYESSRCNIFIVKNSTVSTPSQNVLKGITRQRVLEIDNSDLKIVEKQFVTLDELYDADEVFITSTTKNILPIVNIGDQMISDGKPGNITKSLSQLITDW